MSVYPVFKLEAVQKKDLPSYSPVFNYDEFEYHMWIHVPEYISRYFSLFQIDEMSEPINTLNLSDCCYLERCRPWFRLKTSYINKTPGLHIYRMSFVNKKNNDIVNLFFGYVVQCDHPDKPYRYMDPDTECCCNAKNSIRIQAL